MKNLKIKDVSNNSSPWDAEIYSQEIGYAGIIDSTFVGHINHKKKTVRFCHGYFPPHPTGKNIEKYAKSIGYKC
jgi:hypothetical protein